MTRFSSILRSKTAARTACGLSALLLAGLSGAALGQSRINSAITTVRPSVQLANPSLNIRQTTIQPSALRAMPGRAVNALPTLEASRLATGIDPSEATLTARPQIGGATANTAGLGRLVAPGNEHSDVVVARIGSAAHADISSLTADFDGDGLINFEIAPGIVDGASAGGEGLGGLVGRDVALPTGTADRVLDGVINVEGVVPAATIEIANGAVVLGGLRTADGPGLVATLPTPAGPATRDPNGGDGHVPDPNHGGDPDGTVDDNTRLRILTGCLTNICDDPVPVPKPSPAAAPNLPGEFHFSGMLPPLRENSEFDFEHGDLLDVSIMLPLRGREREGDQFSNFGNEEIW